MSSSIDRLIAFILLKRTRRRMKVPKEKKQSWLLDSLVNRRSERRKGVAAVNQRTKRNKDTNRLSPTPNTIVSVSFSLSPDNRKKKAIGRERKRHGDDCVGSWRQRQ